MTTRETWEAVTVVSAHIVDAFAAICAGFGQAFVQIELAILTLEARRTMAYVGTVIIIAYTVVQARVRLTLIDVHVAIDALVAGPVASASIIIDPIDADATVLARIRSAFVNISFTVLPGPASLTLALVLVIC